MFQEFLLGSEWEGGAARHPPPRRPCVEERMNANVESKSRGGRLAASLTVALVVAGAVAGWAGRKGTGRTGAGKQFVPASRLLRYLPFVGCVLVVAYLGVAYYAVHEIVPRHLRGGDNIYIAQPLIWSGLAALSFLFWTRLPDRPRLNRGLIGLAAIAGVFQISVLVIAGVLYGFGHSPLASEAFNMAKNGVYIVTLLIGLEMSRAYLLHLWSRFHPVLSFGAVAVIYTVMAVPPVQYPFSGGTERAFEMTGSRVLPAASESVLATFFASIGGPLPAIIYRLTFASFEWFSPILPSLDWPVVAFIGTLTPVVTLLIVRNMHDSTDRASDEDAESGISPFWTFAATAIVALIWFNTGMFGVRPSVVVGHSMSPTFETGDLVITREVDPEDLEVGDIIRFRGESLAIMHRIIEIEDTPRGPVFITQGDSNSLPDSPVLAAQIEGEIIVTIPKLGWVPLVIGDILGEFR